MKENSTIRVGITHGDYNGIGYEVLLKMFEDSRLTEFCTPVVYGSAKIAAFYGKALDIAQSPQWVQVKNASDARDGVVNIVNVIGEDAHIEPGQSSPEAGKAAFAALERAVADLQSGTIDVLLTAPINKNNIQSELFKFPGHTEYLESSVGDGAKALMVLCNDDLRVALVTTHLPVARIAQEVTAERIVEKLEIFNRSLIEDFGIVKPRIAVLGLNPHAGDGGLLGTEEKEVILPAIKSANDMKIMAFGPYPADGFFGGGLFKSFDGVLAMYHDQGLAPFKMLAMESGVNFTAGLPYVRTSPDHGTGYDIAGKGKASADSMRAALYRAIDVFRNREYHTDRTRNPLRRQYFDKSKDNVVLDLTKDDK